MKLIRTLALALLLLPSWMVLPALADSSVDFNRDIRPILSTHCFACHGRDEKARKAKLRLDTKEGALAERDGTIALVPGNPDKSALIARVETDDQEDLMPPPKSGHVLSSEQKRLLRAWVQAGGPYDVHWSFVPPVKAGLPEVTNKAWPKRPLDHFVLAGLEAKSLAPSAASDRYRLIRRVSLDLTGLPPTPEEADAFVADRSPEAFTKLVDRLLESPHFGERWARVWLDLARYADTRGYEKDKHRDMWRYREWVIEALNADLSYDAFTRKQLAGDLLPEASIEDILATAFHRNTMTNEEGGTDNEEFRVAAVKDRVDTTMQVWMGLTMGCAKCHAHKYDPISIEDYYAFYAFFNQTEDNDNEAPSLLTPTREHQQAVARLTAEVKRLDAEHQAGEPDFEAGFAAWKQQALKGVPLWQDLKLQAFESKHDFVTLEQAPDGLLQRSGRRPKKDTWTVTLSPPTGTLTALRLETVPKKQVKGLPKDTNVALRELTVELLVRGAEARKLKLVRARADYSQKNWEVAKAVDGNPARGWAFSPHAAKPHAAVFEFAQPLTVAEGHALRLTLEQEYGSQLVFDEFRLQVSSHNPSLLSAHVKPEDGLRERYAKQNPETAVRIKQLNEAKAELKALQGKGPKTLVMRELPPNRQRKTKVMQSGNFLSPGAEVNAQVPVVFGDWPKDAPKNRIGVSDWLLQKENPLTDRVMVNRIWARLFGTGIVETEEDFGLQGLPPSHPELLDGLAVDFRENGRSLKAFLREVLHSASYQQAGHFRDASLKADPGNRLLSRGARFRLPAETIRDQALAVSGLLSRVVGGPSVMPPQPDGVWKTTYNTGKWVNATGPNRYRRGLYTYWKRTSPYPSMVTFDAGSGEVCQIRRVRTNTPLQALITLNDPVYVEAAGALAKRMQEAGADVSTRIERGFRLALIRPPSRAELLRLVQVHDALQQDYGADHEQAAALLKSAGVKEVEPALVGVANVLLNLDEFLMKP